MPLYEEIIPSAAEVTSLEFSPVGPFLLIGDIRGSVHFFDLYHTKIKGSFSRHTLGISALKFMREYSDNFISGSLDSTVKIWNKDNKQELLSLKNDSAVLCIDISPDDSWIVSGCESGCINLYEIATGKLLQTF